jgi:hypothetical protein
MVKATVDLDPQEEVLGMIRRSPWMSLSRFVLAGLWILSAPLLFFPLIRLGGFGLLFVLLLLLTGLLYLRNVWKRWKETLVLVTNRRIIDIDHSHWRRRFVHEWPRAAMGKMTMTSGGLFMRLFRLSILTIHMKEPRLNIEIYGVQKAKHVKDWLDKVKSL